MLEEYFWAAYHPIRAESEKPITGTNEVNVAGLFGDIFDVVYAYPDVAKWRPSTVIRSSSWRATSN